MKFEEKAAAELRPPQLSHRTAPRACRAPAGREGEREGGGRQVPPAPPTTRGQRRFRGSDPRKRRAPTGGRGGPAAGERAPLLTPLPPPHPPPRASRRLRSFQPRAAAGRLSPGRRGRRGDQQAPGPPSPLPLADRTSGPAGNGRLRPTPAALVRGGGGGQEPALPPRDPNAHASCPPQPGGRGSAPPLGEERRVPGEVMEAGPLPRLAAPAHGTRSGPLPLQPRRKFPDVSAGGRAGDPACLPACLPAGLAARWAGPPLLPGSPCLPPPAARQAGREGKEKGKREAAPPAPAPRGGGRGAPRGARQGAPSRPRARLGRWGRWRAAAARDLASPGSAVRRRAPQTLR